MLKVSRGVSGSDRSFGAEMMGASLKRNCGLQTGRKTRVGQRRLATAVAHLGRNALRRDPGSGRRQEVSATARAKTASEHLAPLLCATLITGITK